MELLMILFVAGVAFLIFFISYISTKKVKYRPVPKSQAQIEAEEKHLAEIKRQTGLAVLLGQSKFLGDDATYNAVIDNKYEGAIPEKQDNGSWTSPYQQLLSLPIAGINYRSGVKNCTRPSKARLVPDPKNEYDPDAIKVIHESGTHVGYVPADRTEDIRHLIPCYALCDITEEEDELDPHRHYFRGWIYINTQPQ